MVLLFRRKSQYDKLNTLKTAPKNRIRQTDAPFNRCFFFAQKPFVLIPPCQNSTWFGGFAYIERTKIYRPGGPKLKNKTDNPKQTSHKPDKSPRRKCSVGSILYSAFWVITMTLMHSQPVMAATVWEKASEIMKDVYGQIVLISTVAAIVTASVALLMMNFSRSGKTVDEPCLVKTYLYYLGDFKWSGLHYGLHHPVLCRRQMGWLIPYVLQNHRKGVLLWVF